MCSHVKLLACMDLPIFMDPYEGLQGITQHIWYFTYKES